jgi:hypothetical protein
MVVTVAGIWMLETEDVSNANSSIAVTPEGITTAPAHDPPLVATLFEIENVPPSEQATS